MYLAGHEPDARFSLANERTFLAWVRTSLALMAAGLAVEALRVPIAPSVRLIVAVLLVLAGIGAVAQAWVGWTTTERALRTRAPLPSAGLKLSLVLSLMMVGVGVTIGLLL